VRSKAIGKRKKRPWTVAFKLAAVARMDGSVSVEALAEELGVGARLLYDWHQRYRSGGAAALRRMGRPLAGGGTFEQAPRAVDDERRRIAELERKIGEQQLDLDFFRAALRQVEARRRTNGGPGGTRSTR